MEAQRFDRQLMLFGAAGQWAINETKVVIIGLGGTGSHIAQQLAYLGVGTFGLVDRDRVDETSLNRLVGGFSGDAQRGEFKVDVGQRLIQAIAPAAFVQVLRESVISEGAFARVREADFVFGCVDRDSIRVVLTELTQAYEVPYIDIATDVDQTNARNFGGRLVFCEHGERCLYCSEMIDWKWVAEDLQTEGQRLEDERIYGVPRRLLGGGGPSVVSLNGIMASLAVTEFMVSRTGLRRPKHCLTYHGAFGVVSSCDGVAQLPDCPYCKGIRGTRERANVYRWIQEGWGAKL
jgi:molybdopterin-synthase adenylyltransferase